MKAINKPRQAVHKLRYTALSARPAGVNMLTLAPYVSVRSLAARFSALSGLFLNSLIKERSFRTPWCDPVQPERPELLAPVPELLAPAGDPEKLLFAYLYGADAAYIGAGPYSLRQSSGFSLPQIAAAVSLARSLKKRLYLALNVYFNNGDLDALTQYLGEIARLQPDGLIVSDPAVFGLAKTFAPEIPLHLSTQVNTTNWQAAEFWRLQGAARVNLARELSLDEAAEIALRSGIETEVFIHGAMCISYSGRCLLSSFMTGRSANRGNCSHPCRYRYALTEEKRPGEYFPIEEDSCGSYIMNSKDLCLLAQIPRLCSSGFAALKIEGRNKSAYYVASVTRIYRAAIDAYNREGADYYCRDEWGQELARVSHRAYTEAFATSKATADSMRYADGGYLRAYDFTAVLHGAAEGMLLLEQRNQIKLGDELEILLPDGGNIMLRAERIFDQEGRALLAASHPRQMIRIPGVIDPRWPLPLIVRRPCHDCNY
jgi:U32 family peptidase